MWLETLVCMECDYEEQFLEDDIWKPLHCPECGDILDVIEKEWVGKTKLLSTVECENCHFKFDCYDLALGTTECPQCYSKKLKLLAQKKERVYESTEI